MNQPKNLLLAVSVFSCMALVSCGEGTNPTSNLTPNESSNYVSSSSAHTHSWGEGKVTKEATCTEIGVRTYTCSCGETKTEAISAKGHTKGAGVKENAVDPTCTEEGSFDLVVYCADCGLELSREPKTIAALGHDWGEYVSDGNATCTEDGTKTRTCSRCDATETVASEGSAKGHTAGDFVKENNVPATCTEGGSYDMVVYCTDCGAEIYRERRTIQALGHDWESDWTVDVQPSCTDEGSMSYHCSRCDAKKDVTPINATGHSWGEGTVTQNPTCTEDGVRTFTCSDCGQTKTETIHATGHTRGNAVRENEIAATCADGGSYDEVVYCTVCGTEISREHSTIAATGNHSFSEGKCTVCGLEAIKSWDVSKNQDGSLKAYLFLLDANRSSLVFSGSGEMADYQSQSYAPWYSAAHGRDIVSVSLPESVTTIGNYAFYGSSSLGRVVIPNSVTSIGECAFFGCSRLSSVQMPNSLTRIGNSAFYSCALSSIEIPSSVTYIGPNAFDWDDIAFNKYNGGSYLGNSQNPYLYLRRCDDTSLASFKVAAGCLTIGSYAFNDCSISSIEIPSSVNCIGYNAFNGCASLSSITIPDSVNQIEDETFVGCSSLSSVSIGNSVASIGAEAFSGCASLSSISFAAGSKLASIGNKAFSGCVGLPSVNFNPCSELTSLGDGAFEGCTSLSSIEIPDSVSAISDSSFSGCSSLIYTQTLNAKYLGNANNPYVYLAGTLDNTTGGTYPVPEGCRIIAGSTFSGSTSLYSVRFPSSVVTIGDSAFSGCTHLSKITIPSSVASLGTAAFKGCTSLSSIVIPDSLTSLSDEIFEYCTSLSSITIPSSVTSIGRSAFKGCTSLSSIDIPSSVTSIGRDAFVACSSLSSITIPSGVTSIEACTFLQCSSLSRIEIPSSVTCIGNQAFYNCPSLISIEIPDSVTSIGSQAFERCSSLSSIDIPSSVNFIGSKAFQMCTSLPFNEVNGAKYLGNSENPYLYLYSFGNKDLESFTIPDGCKVIEQGAFNGRSSLRSLTIPSTVTYIGYNQFEGCTSLTSLAYAGTKSQWYETEKDSGWYYGSLTNTLVCSDGEVVIDPRR